jgi:predicted N-acetyltransferase YhbS
MKITAPVPDEVFCAMEPKKDAIRDCCGAVEYPDEFVV